MVPFNKEILSVIKEYMMIIYIQENAKNGKKKRLVNPYRYKVIRKEHTSEELRKITKLVNTMKQLRPKK